MFIFNADYEHNPIYLYVVVFPLHKLAIRTPQGYITKQMTLYLNPNYAILSISKRRAIDVC